MKKILFVCHGNICRSPMAELVMKNLVKNSEVEFYIASAATSTEEIGSPVHRGTRTKLLSVGIDVPVRQAVQMTKDDYKEYDLIVAMDSYNVKNILRITGGDPEAKIYKLMYFTGSDDDVADPWYTGDFDRTYDDVLKGCKALLKLIERGEAYGI